MSGVVPRAWEPHAAMCAVCRRSYRGLGWFNPKIPGSPVLRACSPECVNIIERRQGMIDPTQHELEAMIEASQAAGEFIESIGITDLAEWSGDDWTRLIEAVVTTYTDKLRELATPRRPEDFEPPF
jgi:hypothetical protein